jgi:large subunit ribosomal protein L10
MAITKDKKDSIVAKLKQVAKDAESVVFISFTALPVALATEIRKVLREKGIGYFVAKKTLIRKSFEGSGVSGEMPALLGEVAVVYGTDPLATSKGIYEFQKQYTDKISILGGVYEKSYADGAYLTALAKVPAREVLYAQVAQMINWPIQGLVMVLDQVAKQKESAQ